MLSLIAAMWVVATPPPSGGNFVWELNRIWLWNTYCVAPTRESKNPRDYICTGEGLEAQKKDREHERMAKQAN